MPGLLLPFLSYAAITSAVADWEDLRRILRVFVLSVVVENILAVGSFLAAYFFGSTRHSPATEGSGCRGCCWIRTPMAGFWWPRW